MPPGLGSQMDGASNQDGTGGVGNSTSSHLKMIDGGVDASGKMNQSQTHSLRNSHSNIKASRSLQQALKAGDKQQKNTESMLARKMNEYSKTFDIRAVIFGTFYRCGFDLHELTPSEKQMIEIIQLYPYLKNGEIWRDIEEEFEDTNLKPTSDDKHWM